MKRSTLTYKILFSLSLLLVVLASVSCDDRDEYIAVPVVVSTQPDEASPGQSIYIHGGNFATTPTENIVTISGVVATVNEAKTNRLIVVVPNEAKSGVLSVTVNGQTGHAPKTFTVHDQLKITAITPAKASRLDTITIQGQYFGNSIAENSVKIKDIEAIVTSASFTELKVIVPENTTSGTATVTISAHDQSASDTNFEITDYPPFTFSKNVNAPTPKELKKVAIASVNIAYAVGDEGAIIKSTAPGVWTDISFGSVDYRDVHVIDEQTVLVCGYDGTLIKTTDGGSNWNTISLKTTENLRRMHFISATEGWLVGSDGVMFKTTDGGDNWQSLSSGVTTSLYGVYFINASTGFVVGNDDHILKTTDGGNTWSTTILTTTEDFTSVVFKDENNGWITGEDNVLLATTDGGVTWTDQSISLDSSGDDFNDIVILSDTNIIAVADDHQLAKTEDQGATWTIINLEAALGGIAINDHIDGIDAFRGKAIAVGENGFICY